MRNINMSISRIAKASSRDFGNLINHQDLATSGLGFWRNIIFGGSVKASILNWLSCHGF